jgi:drug/metabolite transporter (DMT)-like permease
VLAQTLGASAEALQHVLNTTQPCCRVGLLVVRGLLGAVSVSTLFFAIHYLPLADATAFTFLAPAFVALASPWVLAEQPLRVWPALIACSVGVLLVTQPGFLFGKTRLPAIGIAFGLAQPLASGAAKVLARIWLIQILCLGGICI